MAKLPGVYELMATAASPAINFARGVLGYQDPFLTQTMQDRMRELESQKGPVGDVSYEDYGLDSSAGRFTGGLLDLAINNPVDFGLAGSVGKYSYNPEGRKGLTYDFTPDQDTGSTGNAVLDFINRGGLKKAISRMGTAEASDLGAIANLTNPVSTTNQFPFKSVAERLAANAISNPFQRTTNVAPVPPFNAQSMQSIFPTNVPPGINNTTSAAMFLDNAGLPAIDTSFGVANEPDVEQENKKSSGIANLFKTLLGFAVPGLGLLTSGLEGIKSFNHRLRNTDLARSRTGVEYFRRRRDRKAREDAAKRGALKQKRIIASQQVDTGDTGGGSGSSYDAPSGGTFGSSVNDASSFSDYS